MIESDVGMNVGMSWSFVECQTRNHLAKYVARQPTTLHTHFGPSFAHGEFEFQFTRKSTLIKGVK